jgi:steroid 5-alpha reductase family enzyme
MTDLFLMALGPLLLIHITYYFAVKKNDLSVIDTTWGLGFIALSLMGNILSKFSNPREILILVMVLLWGLRLSLFIHSRNKGKPEDYRYTQMRNNWGENANRIAYFKVYLLQFGLMLVVGLPIFAIHYSLPSEFLFLDYFGFGLWFVGLLWEAVSDNQKSEFKKTHKHEICDVGLWFYSRHPNYFGEVLVWWGIGAVSLLSRNSWGIFGSIFINFLLLKVTGVPLVEARHDKNPDYQAYKNATPTLIPNLLKRKVKS